MPRFENPIEYQFAGEAAAALGNAGRRLRKALDALHRYDSEVASNQRRASLESRSELVATAGEAFWSYEQHNVKPATGYVPDEQTAIRIAVAIWEPIYGRQQIEGQKPYRATLKDGVWIVEGSLPRGWRGGVALAEISKEDGRVLRVSHGRGAANRPLVPTRTGEALPAQREDCPTWRQRGDG